MPIISTGDAQLQFLRPQAPDRPAQARVSTGSNQFLVNTAASSLGAAGAQTTPLPTEDRKKERGPYAGHMERIPWVLTSTQWMKAGKYLALHAGPSNVHWNLALRAHEEPTASGSARFAAPRLAGRTGSSAASTTYYDLPRVDLSFQGGNILPIPPTGTGNPGLPAGLEDFYSFMELVNQAPFLDGEIDRKTREALAGVEGPLPPPVEGQNNYIWIYYTSLKYPKMLLQGYIDPSGIQMTDSAEQEVTTVTWSCTMVVHQMDSYPWDGAEALSSTYIEYMRTNVQFL